MAKVDLSLVSIDDLLIEVESRCSGFVAVYQLNEEKEKSNDFNTYYGKGNWLYNTSLADILHNDCLNNWSGELRTLQRIHKEETEE